MRRAGTVLVSLGVFGGACATDPTDPPDPVAVGLNDVSILLPLPSGPDDPNTLGFAAPANGGPLLSAEGYGRFGSYFLYAFLPHSPGCWQWVPYSFNRICGDFRGIGYQMGQCLGPDISGRPISYAIGSGECSARLRSLAFQIIAKTQGRDALGFYFYDEMLIIVPAIEQIALWEPFSWQSILKQKDGR